LGGGDSQSLLEHERVVVVNGERSSLPVIVAVHSTALGQAVGGCRMWHYEDWRVGLEDALKLSEAMSLKCALAGLPHGGGKSVIPLPVGMELSQKHRRDVLLDLGDVVESFEGQFGTGEDVGTTAEDMLIVRERTRFAYMLPASQGGSGEPSEPTAVGVMSSIRVTLERIFGEGSPSGRRISIVGLGQVGSRLARRLASEGATLTVTDIDPHKKELADELDAHWVEAAEILELPADLLVPAALGGMITYEVVNRLECSAIAGPANNQLLDDDVAELLAQRGILWAPDFVVNAGGAILGTEVDIHGKSAEEAMARVEKIGETLNQIFDTAKREGVTPLHAANKIARERIESAKSQTGYDL
jgi:leucine dehydrogenase